MAALYFSVFYIFMIITSFSTEVSEGLRMEKQHRFTTKPIKIVKTWVGDTYDCVNIREQPSLNHPLLRNHEIQMPPLGRGVSSTKSSLGGVTVDCPKGTVPIRRISRKDRIRAESFTESFLSNMHPLSQELPGQHFAIVRSKPSYKPSLVAMKGTVSIHAPPNVQDFQSTSARMWMENGANSIQAGWIISPKLYGDNHTRLFGFFKNKDNGCFNLLCGGFVQVNQNSPIDIVFNRTSTPEAQYEVPIRLEKNERTSCWWVITNEDVYIGYWTSGLLPDMDKNGANYIAWGGMTTTSPASQPSPLMGSGNFAVRDDTNSAFIYQLQIVDAANKTWLNPHQDDLEIYQDKTSCYLALYDGYIGKREGHVIYYGGPGGNCAPQEG